MKDNMNMKTMSTLNVLCALMMSLFLSACTNRPKVVSVETVKLDLQTGEGIKKSIYAICTNATWTQSRFTEINNAIATQNANGMLDANINEHKALYKLLFTQSAVCLQNRVDSLFRLSNYDGYEQMKEDTVFLRKYENQYQTNGSVTEKTNVSLDKVRDIFKNYIIVLKLSKSQFYRNVSYLEDYTGSYESTQRTIENNPYYDIYFSHNTDITNGMVAFPQRVRDAHISYLSQLEKIIEKKAVDEGFSLAQLVDVQSTFNSFSNGKNSTAEKALQTFIDNYTEPVDQK